MTGPHAGHFRLNMWKMRIENLKPFIDQRSDPSQLEQIRQLLNEQETSIVALDDDPTGTQTVYQVPVLTSWNAEDFEQILMEKVPLFYVLTNTRSMTASEARKVNIEIGTNLKIAGLKTGRKLKIISRSDSTLRGHYPLEIHALKQAMDMEDSVEVLVPAFIEGGRFTFENMHYVQEESVLVPASETTFARDKVFGFQNSSLPEWVLEKYQNALKLKDIFSLSNQEISAYGHEQLVQILDNLKEKVLILNAVSYFELEKAALALHLSKKNFIYRTAASFVRAFSGLGPRATLAANELVHGQNGGLVVLGSYVKKSSDQLEQLLKNKSIKPFEVKVKEILHTSADNYLKQLSKEVNRNIGNGADVLVYTSRELVSGASDQENLDIGNQVSSALVRIIHSLEHRPRYLIAKGGITSSDIATKGLGIKKARVLGQAIPGVPVWLTGDEALFKGMTYIIFPGNVGSSSDLSDLVLKLKHNP